QWSALLYYVRLFVWPDALSMDHGYPYTTSLLAPRAWLALLVLLAWIGLALRAVRRYPQVTFATAWFFVTLAPESSFVALSEVVNDHRPYIASALGLSVLLAWLLHRGAALVAPRPSALFAAVSLALSIAAVPYDRYRTWQWQDALRNWEDTLRKSPSNGRAWMNAGQNLMSRGELAAARRYFERARELAPRSAFVYMNLRILAAREGHLDEALHRPSRALRPGRAPHAQRSGAGGGALSPGARAQPDSLRGDVSARRRPRRRWPDGRGASPLGEDAPDGRGSARRGDGPRGTPATREEPVG